MKICCTKFSFWNETAGKFYIPFENFPIPSCALMCGSALSNFPLNCLTPALPEAQNEVFFQIIDQVKELGAVEIFD